MRSDLRSGGGEEDPHPELNSSSLIFTNSSVFCLVFSASLVSVRDTSQLPSFTLRSRHEPTLLRPTSLDCTASVTAVHVKFKKGEPTVQQQTGGSQKIFKSEWGAGIVDVEAEGKVSRMSSLEENIKRIILKTLPSLSVETQLQVVSTLQTSGVDSVADLKYVQQEDIKGLLPVIQQRKLLEAFRLETEIIN
ncbi:hypothetical protein SRHO_G00177500 [Serrasalmus rhombeus]